MVRHGARIKPRRNREDGAVAVEFALIFPLLAMMLLGIVTTGISYSHALGLTNAVREGARFAATTAYPSGGGTWVADVTTRTSTLQFDDPSNTTQICVDLYKQGTGLIVNQECSGPTLETPPVFIPPSGLVTGSCAIRVWAARSFSINAVLVNFADKTMVKQSVAMYERETCS